MIGDADEPRMILSQEGPATRLGRELDDDGLGLGEELL